MENIKINELLKKYRLGQCTDDEKALLESWYNRQAADDHEAIPAINFQHQHDELWDSIHQKVAPPSKKLIYLWPRFAAAAIAILVIGAGIMYYSTQMSGKPEAVKVTSLRDIEPGKFSATLTLANGKKIRLNDAANGEIAKESGIAISKSADGQLIYKVKSTDGNAGKINTLSTANGETYVLILPDNTKIWLNAASSLTYSTALVAHGIRKVKLAGEAYFEVAKDKVHPFVVESKNQKIEVLGTHFNVNAYHDEPTVATTLVEGSVKVLSGNTERILKPGLQAITTDSDIRIQKANLETITDWKEGDFNLDGLNFKSAMRKLGRWYNIEVIYDPSVPDNIVSGGWISRNTRLSTILEVVERSGQVHFKLEGSKLYVSK